ncbi:undecaprenyl-phosphate glucose phosphotransferase [Vibrio albus]|uniref:Undecaprenyl-phosphate glucose phosphotransferase n=1 Tax=Vibrio albus TaxID=2200953 RepID=A0A2U3BDJ5_9VIBR|nr:undecaprenyl-phosphate glucose phosphotransferase [Vibrio albus]PWI34812.1 undecaprenyl-phosphate glucose phosphotransferase [Vibrio albus]
MRQGKRIKGHGEETVLAYRILDVFIISTVLVLTSHVYNGDFSNSYFIALSAGVFFYSLMAEIAGVYRATHSHSLREVTAGLFFSWLFTIAVMLFIAFFFKTSESYSRVTLAIWFAFTPVILVVWRIFAYKYPCIFNRDASEQKTVIIGATKSGITLSNAILSNPLLNLQLTGIYDDRSPDRLHAEKLPVPLSGTIDEALHLAKEHKVKHVYVALPMEAVKRIKQIISHFADSNARVYIVPDFFTFDLMQSRWRNVGNVPTLSIHDTPFYGFSSFMKRAEDIILSMLIIALISPVLLAVAVGVKLSSPGPVIFKQQRYGLDGKPIKVWKFRSMKTQDNGPVVKQATKNDPRITPFGSFIRRTSLDELPQFFNVLMGTMSIVGPRPHAVAHNEEYRGLINKYMLRHQVKPGITGWAQINGYRGETDTLDKMEKRVEHDLVYIQSWSLWLDIKIIFLTAFKGFVGKTAY